MRQHRFLDAVLIALGALLLVAGPIFLMDSHGAQPWAGGWKPRKPKSEPKPSAGAPLKKEDPKLKRRAEEALKAWEEARKAEKDASVDGTLAAAALQEARKREQNAPDKKTRKAAKKDRKKAEKALRQVEKRAGKAASALKKAKRAYIEAEDRYHKAVGRRAFFNAYAKATGAAAAPGWGAGSTGVAAEDQNIAPWLEHFPWQLGQRRLFVSYYASRKHRRRKLVKAAIWDEAVEDTEVHGLRVLVLRTSQGSMGKAQGKWRYGEPEWILGESVYVFAPGGVALQTSYRAAEGSDEEYRALREQALEGLRAQSKNGFLSSKKNWILPFPVTPGLRKPQERNGSYCKVLRGGDKRFIPEELREQSVGVAVFKGGAWKETRWYVPGKGVLVHETRSDPKGIDAVTFPFTIKALNLQVGN